MSDEPQSRYDDLEERYESVIEDANLSTIQSQIDHLTDQINELPDKIQEIRERGYTFRSFLEHKAEVFAKQWDEKRHKLLEMVKHEVNALQDEVIHPKTLLKNTERQLDNDTLFERMADQAEEAIEKLEEHVETAAERITDNFETLQTDVSETYSQINHINWILDQVEKRTFEFADGESVFLAAKAELVLTGKARKDPNGFLFLTNQRLIFEQRETTGKKLGMFGGKKEHEVEWETPLTDVEAIEVENKGMFGGKDMMHFTVGGDKITVEVQGSADNNFWKKQVERMMTGESDDERDIEPDEEMLETIKNAPVNCHVCGGTLPQVTDGTSSITCEYCGATISL